MDSHAMMYSSRCGMTAQPMRTPTCPNICVQEPSTGMRSPRSTVSATRELACRPIARVLTGHQEDMCSSSPTAVQRQHPIQQRWVDRLWCTSSTTCLCRHGLMRSTARVGSIWLLCASATRRNTSAHGIHSSKTIMLLLVRPTAWLITATAMPVRATMASGTTATA